MDISTWADLDCAMSVLWADMVNARRIVLIDRIANGEIRYNIVWSLEEEIMGISCGAQRLRFNISIYLWCRINLSSPEKP